MIIKEKKRSMIMMTAGALIFIAGAVLMKLNWDYFYILIGIGAGFFGQGLGDYTRARLYESNPEARKDYEREKKDERNTMIVDRAKSRAFTFWTYLQAVMLLTFSIMKVDMTLIIILVVTYLAVHGVMIYESNRLSREL